MQPFELKFLISLGSTLSDIRSVGTATQAMAQEAVAASKKASDGYAALAGGVTQVQSALAPILGQIPGVNQALGFLTQTANAQSKSLEAAATGQKALNDAFAVGAIAAPTLAAAQSAVAAGQEAVRAASEKATTTLAALTTAQGASAESTARLIAQREEHAAATAQLAQVETGSVATSAGLAAAFAAQEQAERRVAEAGADLALVEREAKADLEALRLASAENAIAQKSLAAAKSESAAASKVLASAETEATAATTGLAASLGPLALVLGAIAAAFMAVKTAVDFTKEAVGAAAKEEGTEAAFIPLLGSLEKAQARIEEVNAAATRFRLDPVALRQADEELTRLSGGALGAGKSLETLIEMGARVRGGVQAVASIYGRFYEALDNGQPIGRAGTQLQRMGLLAAADVNHLNNLQKSGARGSEIMASAEQARSTATGAADVQANSRAGASKGIKG
ncbi:MAG: hypothetical protein JO117_05145, partial [Verrucomicrobia bacterium]|nr:hypothetical protein [Verrucomicrobiota bacterium]